MFEGHNEITFSSKTAHEAFGKFMSDLFQLPITVTDIEKDYRGVKITFTATAALPLEKQEDPDADA